MVCMFSHWTEALPCTRAIDYSMEKVLLEKIITTWEMPLKLHGNWETQLTGQVF